MTSAPAAAPPPHWAPVSPPRSATPMEDLGPEPVLQGSECAVWCPPPPAAPRCPPTTPTSGTRATPAATLQQPRELAPSPSTRPLMMSVS